jgi:hypothetical protein
LEDLECVKQPKAISHKLKAIHNYNCICLQLAA